MVVLFTNILVEIMIVFVGQSWIYIGLVKQVFDL